MNSRKKYLSVLHISKKVLTFVRPQQSVYAEDFLFYRTSTLRFFKDKAGKVAVFCTGCCGKFPVLAGLFYAPASLSFTHKIYHK